MPSKIGPYAIVDLLGKGGMGQVWLGQQFEPVPRRAAVKVVAQGAGLDILRRFDEERRLLAGLEHPAIAKVFEVGTTEDGRPWFAMEYVQGQAIHTFCQEHALDLQQRLELFRRVCLAVQHAHARGIVHRDLKPNNILVEFVDEDPLPKIIDFGVAKALDGRSDDNPLRTAFGGFIGTPAYASPEQAGGDPRQIDVRADVYSLGAVLYQILTDVPPFDPKLMARMTSLELQRTIAEKNPAKPSKRAKTGFELEGLDDIVMCALQKRREKRFANAGELASAIEAHVGVRAAGGGRSRPRWMPWIAPAALALVAVLWGVSQAGSRDGDADGGEEGRTAAVGVQSGGAADTLPPSGPVGVAMARVGDVLRMTWEARPGLSARRLFHAVYDASEDLPATAEAVVERGEASSAPARELSTAADQGAFFRYDMTPKELAPTARRAWVLEFLDAQGYRSLSRVVWEPSWAQTPAPLWRALDATHILRADGGERIDARPCALHCNDDGWPELVVVRNGVHVQRFLATGAGTYAMDSVDREFSRGQDVIAVRTCNVEGDRADDLIVATRSEIYTLANELALAKKNEKADFSRHPKHEADYVRTRLEGGRFASFDVGDANGDGLVDLAVLERAGTTVLATLYFGSHSSESPFIRAWRWLGDEQSRRFEVAEDESVSLALTDLDADGRDELVVAETSPAGRHVLHVTPGGASLRSSSRRCVSPGVPPLLGLGRSVFLDYDGDLRVDLLVRHEGKLYLRRAKDDGLTFEAARALPEFEAGPIVQLDAGDFDKDGVLDLALVRAKSDEHPALFEVLLGRRDSDTLQWTRRVDGSQKFPRDREIHALVPVQLDGDDVTDFWVVEADPRGMSVRSVLGRRCAPRPQVAVQFGGERRGAFLAADVVPGPHPGVHAPQSRLIAAEEERVLYLESATARESARVRGVAQAAAPHPAGLRASFFARLLDRVGRELVVLGEDGMLAIEVFPRGGRPLRALDTSGLRGSRFDAVYRARFGGPLDWLVVQEDSQLRLLRVRGARVEDSGAMLRLRDVPERVFLGDFDGNGVDDVLALRSMRTGETEYELHFACRRAGEDRPSFYAVTPRGGPNRAPRLSFDGRVEDLALVPHGARVGYDDRAYKKALLLAYDSGAFQILDLHNVYSELPPWRLVDYGQHVEAFPKERIGVLSADFNADGLEDLVVAKRDGSAIELRLQDAEDVPGTALGRGAYDKFRYPIETPWKGEQGWELLAMHAMHQDCDGFLDLLVLARHESGKISAAVWYVR